MARFPISPRYSKMLISSDKEILPYTIAIISALTVQEIFEENDIKKLNKLKEKWRGLPHVIINIMIS